MRKQIKEVYEKINNCVENSQKILPIIVGINVAIVGKVNVGKSSLLNVLLNQERAIVSDIPGTTRDTISEVVNINNIPMRIIDTAGIREHSQNVIEKIGIERTKNVVEEADLVLFLLDGSQVISEDDEVVADIISEMSKDKKR